MSNYPPVAFLTMAWDPIATMRAIIGAGQQSYPGRKVIYLLHQKQPPEITWEGGVVIKQFVDKGKWPPLWLKKFQRFLKECKEEYFVWWDEDDRFENEYVEKALAPVLSRRCALAWNHQMVMVRGNALNLGRYRSAIGTLAGQVAAARYVAKLINPGGKNSKDCQYKKLLARNLQMPKHDGLRYYIHHKNSHTTRFTRKGRAQGEDVDA